MAFEENSLRNAWVGNAALKDVDGIVLKVVVNGAFAKAVVLGGTLNNWLLEVGWEIEDLDTVELSYLLCWRDQPYNNKI